MTATPAPAAAAVLSRIIETLDSLEVPWESGTRTGELVITLPGERKLKTVASILVQSRGVSTSAFVIRHPDENEAAFHRYLLQRNLRLAGMGYAIDADGDVYLTGSWPLAAFGPESVAASVDQLLGTLMVGADEPFNDLLVLGFLTSMKAEWAWRVDRGESLTNLEAFRELLAREGDPPRAESTHH